MASACKMFAARMWWARPGAGELLALVTFVAAARVLLGWPVIPFAATLAATFVVLTAIEVTVDMLADAGDGNERA